MSFKDFSLTDHMALVFYNGLMLKRSQNSEI